MRSYSQRLLFLLIVSPFLLFPPRLEAVTSNDYYQAALQLYNAKSYSQSIPYFGAAIALDPNNLAAYQGRANCEYTLGDKPAALSDYQKVYSLHPTPQLSQFIQMLQGQMAAPPPIAAEEMKPAPFKDITYSDKYEIRIIFGASTLSLDSFKSNTQSFVALAQSIQSNGVTNVSYNGTVPDGAMPQFGIEISRRFSPELECGLFFTYLPVGTITDDFEYPNVGGTAYYYASKDSYNLTGYLVGAQFRYTFSHGDFRPFATLGLMATPLQIAFTSTDDYQDPSLLQEDEATLNGAFSAVGFGGQAQVGLDWDLGDGFVVSPAVGYQYVSVNNFQATLKNTSAQGSQGSTATLEVVPTDFGKMIIPIINGNTSRMIYNNSTTIPFTYPGSSAPSGIPLRIDMSGLKGNLQISYNF
jgi:hypothetical protein